MSGRRRYRSRPPQRGQSSLESVVAALAVAAVVALAAHSPFGELVAAFVARHAGFAFALALP